MKDMNDDVRLLKIQIILMEAGIERDKAEKMAIEISEVTKMAAPTPIVWPEYPTYPINPYPTNPIQPWITYTTDGISKETEVNVTTFKA